MAQHNPRLEQLKDELTAADAKLLEIRKDPSRHSELIAHRDAVFAARNQLAAYEAELKRG